VLAALAAYQNPDGGLGNALEPDLRGPASQPEPVEVAFRVLDELDPAATGEVHGPLDFAPTPDTVARRLFSDEVIEAHLDHLLAGQLPRLNRGRRPGMARLHHRPQPRRPARLRPPRVRRQPHPRVASQGRLG
jgi:hypothetical protein